MSEDQNVIKLRNACLKRGATGIKGIRRQFKIMDDDRSKSLSFEEFRKGIHDFGLVVADDSPINTICQLQSGGVPLMTFPNKPTERVVRIDTNTPILIMDIKHAKTRYQSSIALYPASSSLASRIFMKAECRQMFAAFDTDGTGSIGFEEFLARLRPPMSDSRINMINKAFKKADATGDGVINAKDLKGIYNVRHHPKYMNGEWTERQCFEEFLKNFEPDEAKRDGQVTLDEFIDYYSGVSNSIDDDAYFDLMMRNAWKI
eukprot:gene4395-20620_t